MFRICLPFVVAALTACASSESPTPGESPLVVARVERVDTPVSLANSPVLAALGPIGLALRAVLDDTGSTGEAILLTQTGERVQLALGPRLGRPVAAGDCVGLMPVDVNAGLQARYLPGQARLARSRSCGELAR